MQLRIAVFVVVSGLSVCFQAPRANAAFGVNLLVNGSAEAGSSSSTGTPVSVPGWTTTSALTVVPYGSPGGFPTTAQGPADGGIQFFAGGNAAVSTATQDIDVSTHAADIDSGQVICDLSAWLGGFAEQTDDAVFSLTFRQNAATDLTTISVGPVTAEDRSNMTGLLQTSLVAAVPANTRSIHAVLTLTRQSAGPFNDGYADRLSVILLRKGTFPDNCILPGTLGTAPDGGATGTLSSRLLRGGDSTTCDSAPYPGISGTGPFPYNVHYITNNSANSICTLVTLHYLSGGTATVNMQVAAFKAPFVSQDVANSMRYLGDPGASSGSPPADTSFPVTVPAGATIALVVFNVNASPAGSGAAYQLVIDQSLICTPKPVMSLGNVTLSGESCQSPNGRVDPGETVTVALALTNNGNLTTGNLIATLQSGNGVTNPSSPQSYGQVASGQTVTRSFTFTADSNLTCGASVTLSLQLSDGVNTFPTLTSIQPTGTFATLFSENFDAAVPPALPMGWTADQGMNPGGSPPWVTSNSHAAFTPDPAAVLDNRLYSPVVTYPANAELHFQQNYDLEEIDSTTAADAGVLEININGAGWQDIAIAGGVFLTGGYNHTEISSDFDNPLAGARSNWSGLSNNGLGGSEACAVKLPPASAGMPVQFRWRMGSDDSVGRAGWSVDSVTIVVPVCCGSSTGTPFRITSIIRQQPGGAITINGLGQAGSFYTLKAAAALTQPFDTTLGTTKANGSGQFTFGDMPTGTARFYEVNSP
jgi:hypothetical protein